MSGPAKASPGGMSGPVWTCLGLSGPVQEDKYLLQTNGNTSFPKNYTLPFLLANLSFSNKTMLFLIASHRKYFYFPPKHVFLLYQIDLSLLRGSVNLKVLLPYILYIYIYIYIYIYMCQKACCESPLSLNSGEPIFL